MMQEMVWIDDQAVTATEAKVSVFDLGFLRGMAAFESLRTYDGHPHALHAHLARLWTCTRAFGLDALHDEQTVRQQIRMLLETGNLRDCRINFIATPGRNTNGLFGAENPTWVIIARALKTMPAEHYQNGISVVSFTGQRLLPELKTTNYLSGQHGMQAAAKDGASEAIYVDEDGLVHEGVTSNVLLLRNNRVVEPTSRCLAGITKQLLRERAEAAGLGWQSAAIYLDDLLAAEEVWITSSIRELVPVVSLDGHPIGKGRPGPWAQRLGPDFHRHCVRQARLDAEAAQ